MIDIVQVTIANKLEVIYGHSNGIFNLDPFQSARSMSNTFLRWISWKWWQRKHCYCYQIEGRVWAFEWHICIWSRTIPKVKVMHIYTVTIFEMMSDNEKLLLPSSHRYAFHWRTITWPWSIPNIKVKVMNISTVYFLKIVIEWGNIAIAIEIGGRGLSICIFTLDLAWSILNATVKVVNFRQWISHKCWEIWKILLLPSNEKSYMGFQFKYSYFTLTHSQGKDQSHAHFNIKYLWNCNRYVKLLPTIIKLCAYAILIGPIQMSRSRSYTIQEVVYGLSVGIFTFDHDPFDRLKLKLKYYWTIWRMGAAGRYLSTQHFLWLTVTIVNLRTRELRQLSPTSISWKIL